MANKNNPLKTYTMVLEYAKVFDQEGKFGDLDRGDPKSTQKWLRDLAKCPTASVNCYFTSEEDMQDLLETEGFQNEVLNPQNGAKSYRIKDGNEEFGIGKFIQLRRKSSDIREIVDRKSKTGEIKEVEFGGPVTVVYQTENEEGKQVFKEYDYDELGPITGGSTALVKFHPNYMRLEKLGVTNLVEWVDNGSEDGF